MINNKPLVSVIIPSYNHADYVLNAIDSIVKQTYQNWELILIDDGSTDNTHQILSNHSFNDSRIKIILNKQNRRQSYVLNKGIELSNGEYICFLPSDDWYLPDKIEKQVAIFGNLDDSYGVVYSGGLRYFEDTKELLEVKTNQRMRRGNIFKDLLLSPGFVYPASPLFLRKVFDKIKFDEQYLAQGEAIYYDIALEWKFDFIDEPLVVMRDHSYNTGKNIDYMLKDNVAYRKYLFNLPNFPLELKRYKGAILGEIYRTNGLSYIKLYKENKKGVRCLFSALMNDARLFFDYKVLGGIVIGLFQICIGKE